MTEYLKPITKQSLKIILNQMENSFYKINEKEGEFDIGFFCYLKYKNKAIPVLITSNNAINAELNNTIKISNNKGAENIVLGDTRYKNEKFGISIIEIKNDKKYNINFLEIDDCLYKNDSEIYLHKESIYIIHYTNEINVLVTYGVINYINNNEIKNTCNTNLKSKCSVIFNLFNNQIIGLHKNIPNNSNKNIFFKFFIKEFIDLYEYAQYINKFKLNNKYSYNQSSNNEIDILIKVDEEDINKEIYFVDNYEYKDSEDIIHYHDNLKELNKLNTELYIKKKNVEYKKFFVPERKGKYNIKLKFKTNLSDCSYMFAGCEKIIEINFISFNTKFVTNMKYMFHRCRNLKKINLFLFDTKNVTDMSDMFSFCENLETLDLNSFNTKNVTNMDYMFYNCNNLKYLDISYFDFKNNTSINYMYKLCCNLKLSSFKIKNQGINKYQNEINILVNINESDVRNKIYFLDNYEYKDSEGLLHYHDNLKELNNLNTELYINDKKKEFKKFFEPERKGKYNIKLKFNIYLTNCCYMFAGCEKIIEIDFITFDTKYVLDMKGMFNGCRFIKNINNLSLLNTRNVINISDMFCHCYELNNLDFSSFNVKNVKDMSGMFFNCYNLNSLDLSSFDSKNITDTSYMFYGCKNLNILKIPTFHTKNVTDMSYMFYGCRKINNLVLSSFNTKNVTNMNCMFQYCYNLKNLDLSNFVTENVINMSGMFQYCFNLDKLNLSSFNTQNVIDMNGMFMNCYNLKDLNISSFNTKNVTNMSEMFCQCNNLTSINLSSFDTRNVINMCSMFESCTNLKIINLSFFNTSKVINMSCMFSDLSNLIKLDLSSFDTTNVTNMSGMFYNCENLKSLNLSNFNTQNVNLIKGIFHGCPKEMIDSNKTLFKKFDYNDLVSSISKIKMKKSL